MKQKVLEVLKPKAASFGFTKEELESVSESIAKTLQDDATDEQITLAVDNVLPYLQLSQSASARIVTAAKKKLEEEMKNHTTPPPATVPPTTPPSTPPAEPNEDEPAWFKKYREESEKRLNEQKELIDSMKKQKVNEDLMAKALEKLKDVDPGYYSLALDGKVFENEEGMNDTVSKITAGWEKLCQERNIQSLKQITPPGGGTNPPEKASEGVTARIEARKAESANVPSAIKGLPSA